MGELNAALVITLASHPTTKGRGGGRKEEKVVQEERDHVRAAENHLLCGELQAGAAAVGVWQHES